MRHVSPLIVVAAILAAVPAQRLSAQWTAGVPGEDLFSFAVHVGLFSPSTDLSDGTSWDSGTSIGLSAHYWPFERFGLQGFAYRSETAAAANPATPASYHDPVVKGAVAGPVLRYPMSGGSLAMAPYASAGVGFKHYTWAIDRPDPSDAALAWSLAGGIDLRPASSPQYGVLLDARLLRSNYRWHGFQREQEAVNDLVLSLGVSLNR